VKTKGGNMKLNKQGFTMVELLVVLLIIGILAAVATPLYLSNTNRAKASEAVATMGMIRQAEREYFTKHNVYLPVTAGNLSNEPEATSNKGLGIDVGIPQYFAAGTYSVTSPATAFTDGTTAVNFLIKATGAANLQGTGTGQAVRADDVAVYQLEMDNTGTILVKYSNSGSWTKY
jgi:prepilin-type N-terminal cleavage/methylation domain-containing protein